jgi:hypothetical protein
VQPVEHLAPQPGLNLGRGDRAQRLGRPGGAGAQQRRGQQGGEQRPQPGQGDTFHHCPLQDPGDQPGLGDAAQALGDASRCG